MVNKFSLLAGAGVALVVLIDLANGQGPPGLNNYMGPPPMGGPQYRPPMQPMAYGPRDDYEQKKFDKDSHKGKEFIKEKSDNEMKKHHGHPEFHGPMGVYEKGYDREYEKDHTTPAPGMWNSLTNTWNNIRGKRDVDNKDGSEEKGTGARTFGEINLSSEDGSWKQYGSNQAYIFFKVPRNLVCNN